jgi:hypothetical protein
MVTGEASFMGSHLVDRLIKRRDSVIIVDNFLTGRKENVMHHFRNPKFELIRHDVIEPLLLEVDQIYHLICPASPMHYKFKPVNTIISFQSTFNYLFSFQCFHLLLLLLLLLLLFGKLHLPLLNFGHFCRYLPNVQNHLLRCIKL